MTNPGGRGNPPTLDGTPTTGNFIISDSDSGGGSNPPDSGAQHNISSPSFSTMGGNGQVWLHTATSAILNNNGRAIFDVEISTDSGKTWTTVKSRVAPSRVAAAGDVTTRLATTDDADGYFGQYDVDLTKDVDGVDTGVVDNDNVSVRLRHYEPNDDWWIAVDNFKVNDTAPQSAAANTFFTEGFGDSTLGQMLVSGLNVGTTDTWTTADKGNRYEAGDVGGLDRGFDGRAVNRIMQTDPEGPNGEVQFAMIESDADPDPAQDEYLMTPAMELGNQGEVVLQWDSENVALGDINEVLVMRDDNLNGPDSGDTVVGTVFNYFTGAALVTGEDPLFAQRAIDVSSLAAGEDRIFFAWHFQGQDDWWWAVDNINVSGDQDFLGFSEVIPEPSSILLLAMGLIGLCLWGRRR
jgi:hypothetical protein